jgi:hypothetical protein
VKRDGYYGKDKQFVRWKCMASDGDRPHLIRPELSIRLVGGLEGACEVCERPWEPTDGLPQAVRDRFVLRHKVEALVAMGRGESYRQAAWNARRIAKHPTRPGRTRSFSDDRRMSGDWVGQYAEILATALLPDRWPSYAIAVDEYDVRTIRFRDDATRVQRGGDAYTVLGVVGYESADGPGRLWRLAARPSGGEADWASAFEELPGAPEVIVSDGAWGARNAAIARWEGIRAYGCAWHREERARKRLAVAGHVGNTTLLARLLLRRDAAGRVPCEVFTDPWAYLCFRRALRAEIEATGSPELVMLESALNKEREQIWRELTEPHKPLSIGAVEDNLDQVQRLLGDRARLFGNLPRLNGLLQLVQLHLTRLDDPAAYSRILRENHLAHAGSPPPRRQHDGAGLAMP